ncbi:MAG: 23S rRNA (guanosine(2251)-2'-O)-methyltransferase RlmB [Alphaproteobacteria bacterium]|nr:23S rRNA (guanosine(2251)-2'-O)-methyltransferase RlmB [Alphaproteobacteria bacterium]
MAKKTQFSSSSSSRSYWIYGKHAIIAAVSNPLRVCRRLVVTQNALTQGDALLAQCLERKIPYEILDPKQFLRFVPESAVHQGLACEVEPLPLLDLRDYLAMSEAQESPAKPEILVLLDQVTDPHNVGAILRSCAAFKVGALIVPKHHSPDENAVIAKTASGALDMVPLITVTNLNQTLDQLKDYGFWCFALDVPATQDITKVKGYDKIALVLGAEGKGIRPSTLKHCDVIVQIPIISAIGSLNVSNAAAIALYEVSRV